MLYRFGHVCLLVTFNCNCVKCFDQLGQFEYKCSQRVIPFCIISILQKSVIVYQVTSLVMILEDPLYDIRIPNILICIPSLYVPNNGFMTIGTVHLLIVGWLCQVNMVLSNRKWTQNMVDERDRQYYNSRLIPERVKREEGLVNTQKKLRLATIVFKVCFVFCRYLG